jgi:hypothetical protein
MSNVTLATFKTYLREEKPTVDDSFLQAALDAADLTMNDECKRQFVIASGPATSRVYAPKSVSDLLRIHDCTTVTAVSNDGTAVASTDYQLEPLNGLSPAGEARPYDQIRYLTRTGTSSSSFNDAFYYGNVWYWDAGRATVTITATWGWASIPPLLVEGLKVMAKDIAGNRDVQNGVVGFTDAGAASARKNMFVMSVIKHYRREEAKAGIGGIGR